MPFFDRFRVELARYDAGVHDVGDPVDDERLRGRTLPPQLDDFYRSWDGARLFADTIILVPLAALRALDGGGVALGEWPDGALELAADGRVRSRGDDGATIVVGSTLEKLLAALMAREGLLVERDGEFKDVFDEDDVAPRVREKQTRAALKIDPDAAAWHLEAAERAFDDGDDAAAEAALARAVALDEEAGEAWALLGALQRRSGRLLAAAASFARAAAATPAAATRAERAAEAARAAHEAGDAATQAAQAALARAADAGAAQRWIAEARQRLDDGDADGALNRATLAAAIAPDEAAPVVRDARLRGMLKTVT
jgi:tetratricopeptide (TPR) repeat protein